jgi:hypothetical protein
MKIKLFSRILLIMVLGMGLLGTEQAMGFPGQGLPGQWGNGKGTEYLQGAVCPGYQQCQYLLPYGCMLY